MSPSMITPNSVPRRAMYAARALATEGFSRDAPNIDTRPAKQLSFNDGGVEAFFGQPSRQSRAGLPGADDYCVVFFGHIVLEKLS